MPISFEKRRNELRSNLSVEKNENILPVEERVINYKQKKIREQMRNNTKSHQGFGYTYKPFQFNLNK